MSRDNSFSTPLHKRLFSVYIASPVYYIAGATSIVFVLSYFFPGLFRIGSLLMVLLFMAMIADVLLLFSKKNGILAKRITTDRYSIGDPNRVEIHIKNKFPFPVRCHVIDELPPQFQERNWMRKTLIDGNGRSEIIYTLTPISRGEYSFGHINVFIRGLLGLIKRRFEIPVPQIIKVYPSFFQMRRYQLLAVSNRLQEAGVKQIRKLGHSMEFEQIKEYVRGDDFRTINWKATARKDGLMVNSFTDERSQAIYCIINKGRVMKMPFAGMSLLDYAINASLVLCNVALVRQDKAGLITFAQNLDTFIPADKKTTQLNTLLESLYKQETLFHESDFEKLFSVIRTRITNRSLLVLFTNFESMESLQREMQALKKIARYHLLLVIFFENTELKILLEKKVSRVEDIYIRTIAEKYMFEKKLMVKELQKNGILSFLTTPQQLTIDTINKYLELKKRASI